MGTALSEGVGDSYVKDVVSLESKEDIKCEKTNEGWKIAITVFVIIFIIMFLWVTIWAIIVISNPVWVKTINVGQDEPEEDATADLKMAAIYAAIIDIGICIVLGIIFGCTNCWYPKTKKI